MMHKRSLSYRNITWEISTLCPEEIGLCGKQLFGLLVSPLPLGRMAISAPFPLLLKTAIVQSKTTRNGSLQAGQVREEFLLR